MSDTNHTSHGNGASHGDFAKIFNNFGEIRVEQTSAEALTFSVTIPLLVANRETQDCIRKALTNLRETLWEESGKVCSELGKNDNNADKRHRGLLDRLLGSDAAKPESRGRNFVFSMLLFFIGIGVVLFGAYELADGVELAQRSHDEYVVQVEAKRKYQTSLEYPVKQRATETSEAFVERCKSNLSGLNGHSASVDSAWYSTLTGIKLACSSIAALIMGFVLILISIAFLTILYLADMIWVPANADKIFPKTRKKIVGLFSKKNPSSKD